MLKARAANDAHAFNRGGLTVKAPSGAVPMTGTDRINRARDEYVRRARTAGPTRNRRDSCTDCAPQAA